VIQVEDAAKISIEVSNSSGITSSAPNRRNESISLTARVRARMWTSDAAGVPPHRLTGRLRVGDREHHDIRGAHAAALEDLGRVASPYKTGTRRRAPGGTIDVQLEEPRMESRFPAVPGDIATVQPPARR
jgi:hypothetical protein